jgi:hypothetical protein
MDLPPVPGIGKGMVLADLGGSLFRQPMRAKSRILWSFVLVLLLVANHAYRVHPLHLPRIGIAVKVALQIPPRRVAKRTAGGREPFREAGGKTLRPNLAEESFHADHSP